MVYAALTAAFSSTVSMFSWPFEPTEEARLARAEWDYKPPTQARVRQLTRDVALRAETRDAGVQSRDAQSRDAQSRDAGVIADDGPPRAQAASKGRKRKQYR